MQLIVQMRFTSKMKLSCHDQYDQVQFVKKTRHDNDVIDRIGLVYAEIETEMLGPI